MAVVQCFDPEPVQAVPKHQHRSEFEKNSSLRLYIISLLTSLGGGAVNALSKTICDANLTSSRSMIFFFAWFVYTLASSRMQVTYPKHTEQTILLPYWQIEEVTPIATYDR